MKWFEKITMSEQNAIQKTLENSNGLKITSVVIAILMFLTINQVGSPIWKNYFVKTGYIEGVPITVEYDSSKYVISGVPQTINVNISGSENNVQSVLNTKENLLGNLQLNYKGTGKYTVSSEKLEFNTTSNVKISPTISSFDVYVQERVTQKQSVDINYINGDDAQKGYVLDEPILEKKIVDITGGNNDVANVAAVRGIIDLKQLNVSDEKQQEFTVNLVPYNASGEIVTGVSVSPKTINVTQKYNQLTYKVPVKFSEKDNVDNQYISSLCKLEENECKGIEPLVVEIYGNRSKIQATKYVEYQVDFSSYDEQAGTIAINPLLESGVYSLASNPKQLQVKMNQGIKRKIEAVPIKIKNLQDGLVVDNELTTSVDVIGPKNQVEKLKADDIDLSVDMTNVKTAKNTELIIDNNIKDKKDYNVILSNYTVNIETKKGE